MWRCLNCQEEVDEDFDVCWNCQSAADGSLAEPSFSGTRMGEINVERGKEVRQTKEGTVCAGFWIRAAAWALDAIILLPFSALLVFALYVMESLTLYAINLIPFLLYKPLYESISGATIGKKVCGLRVVNSRGGKLRVAAAYIRYAPYLAAIVVSFLFTSWDFPSITKYWQIDRFLAENPYYLVMQIIMGVILIDCLSVAVMDSKRAIHDFMAGSYCIRKKFLMGGEGWKDE